MVSGDTRLPPAPNASSAGVRAVMQANRKKDTGPERALRSHLHRMGLRYRLHARPEPGIGCTADLVMRPVRVAVFVDGCFWHGCPVHGVRPRTNRGYWDAKIARNVERDRRNDEALQAAGWTVVRVWEHVKPEEAAERISQLVRERRAPRPNQPSTSGLRG